MNQNNPEVFINNENNYSIPINIEEVVKSTLIYLKSPLDISVGVSFIDEIEMIELNGQYIGYAHSTDVLSFESNEVDPETGFLFLGDIIICYPYVQNQSNNLGNQLENEILLMVIHGLLHLSGFDHDTEESKTKMWDTQTNILNSLEIKINKLPE